MQAIDWVVIGFCVVVVLFIILFIVFFSYIKYGSRKENKEILKLTARK